MTLDKLNKHFELIEDRAKAQDMLRSLREAAYPGATALTGMPHAPGIRDKTGDLAAEIADIDARIQFLDTEISASEATILPWIATIRDDQTRLIFRLRFLRGLAWKEVAAVIGGRNTDDSVRQACYRHLGS